MQTMLNFILYIKQMRRTVNNTIDSNLLDIPHIASQTLAYILQFHIKKFLIFFNYTRICKKATSG